MNYYVCILRAIRMYIVILDWEFLGLSNNSIYRIINTIISPIQTNNLKFKRLKKVSFIIFRLLIVIIKY